MWQVFPNDGWHDGWLSMDRPSSNVRIKSHVVGRNADGCQEIFAVGDDDALWQKWQVALNVGWTDWESLGKPKDRDFPEAKDRDLSEPLVQENPDGHLEVFTPGNGAFCNRWQEAPNSPVWRHQGWNAKPQPKPEVGITWLEAALDVKRRRVEVLALGDDGAL